MTPTTDGLPELPEPFDASIKCEDCDGSGVDGDPVPQGEFQPPEYHRCNSCDGSGRWKVPAYTADETIRIRAEGIRVATEKLRAELEAAQNLLERIARNPENVAHSDTLLSIDLRAAISKDRP